MKTKTLVLLSAAALGAALLAGCDTPETRIRSNPEAFARLNPDQQSLVKAGRVGIGFDMDAVKLALGNPDRITVRTTAQGQTQVWHYVEYVYYDSGYLYPGPMYWGGAWGGYGRRGGWGGWGWGGYGGWGWWGPFGPAQAQVYDRFRVEFQNGKVTNFAQEMQS
jgi:hypothetical protein